MSDQPIEGSCYFLTISSDAEEMFLGLPNYDDIGEFFVADQQAVHFGVPFVKMFIVYEDEGGEAFYNPTHPFFVSPHSIVGFEESPTTPRSDTSAVPALHHTAKSEGESP